jgi:hypothetical protein
VEIPGLGKNADARDNKLIRVKLLDFNPKQDALIGEVVK